MGLLGFVFLQTEAAAESGLDLVDILLHASLPVQLVIAVLVIMSIICWVIIFAKFFMLKAAEAKNSRFMATFWGDDSPHWDAARLEDVYGKVGIMSGSPIAAVFKSGYVELAKISGAGNAPRHGGELENVTRSLKRSAGTELNRMESMVPFLATTGSTAPFIGLFGTVWGIMETFMKMKGADKSIDAVVGPIAEALVATAIGLAAAIPAVMAYNYFVRKLRTQEIDIDAFESDFLNIVRRYFLRT